MAALAIIFTSLWSLVLSQDSKACVTDHRGLTGSEDETSMVQVNVAQSHVKSDLLATQYLQIPDRQWRKPAGQAGYGWLIVVCERSGATGDSCQMKCGGVVGGADKCDVNAMNAINSQWAQITGIAGISCGFYSRSDDQAAPYIEGTDFGFNVCHYSQAVPTCGAIPPPGLFGPPQRVCVCRPSPTIPAEDSGSAGGQGDPHLRSFRGAHYTLLQQGVFIAWNFSKPVPAPNAPPAGWQLLAAYAGERFTTQGLLLLDPHAGSMEITAEDCTWQIKQKKTPWRQAHLEQISAEDGTTSLQVKKLHEKLGETKILRSSILLQMGGPHGTKSIARLVAHCSPHNHLDFKITMFDRKDVQYVGGELGVAPDENNNFHFFSKKSMVQMRADQEFKAHGSWLTLGGSPAGAAYLEKQHTAVSLTQSKSCSDAEEESARAECSKHLDEDTHPETFSDCVFDLCHGGDESFAQSAAAFLMPLDDSSA